MTFSFLKSWNLLVNTIIFPGSTVPSSYSVGDFDAAAVDSSPQQRLLFIPFGDYPDCPCPYSGPKYIVCLLTLPSQLAGSCFIIHWHGNMTDLGQLGACARYECEMLNAYHLAVEFPRYGVCRDGYPTEAVLNAMAKAVHRFVVRDLKIASNRIVLVGRSIGTGPTCYLASYLETVQQRPAAVILHAPFVSLRDAAFDLLGCFSFLFLNRFENWRTLHPDRSPAAIASHTASKIDTVVNPLFVGADLPSNVGYRRTDQSDPAALATATASASSDSDAGDGIIGCPVLFIHGDSDKIIDPHHSVMMHEARWAAGLPSVLHIQRSSSPEFKRGHNYFDYHADLVEPMQVFLREQVPAYASKCAVTVPADRLDAACVVPQDFHLERSRATEPPQQQGMSGRGPEESAGSSSKISIAASPDSSSSEGRRSAAQECSDDNNDNDKYKDKNEDEDEDFFSSLPSCRCLLCPCTLCCEATASCALTGLAGAADAVRPPTASGVFRYKTKAQRGQEHMTTAKIVHALLTSSSKNLVAGFVVEEVPAYMRDR